MREEKTYVLTFIFVLFLSSVKVEGAIILLIVALGNFLGLLSYLRLLILYRFFGGLRFLIRFLI